MTHVDLTEAYLATLSPAVPVLAAGDSWDLRFSVQDAAGAQKDLTGAVVVASFGGVLRSTSGVTGGVPQVELDNQDPLLATATTGTGWGVVRFRPADEASLLALPSQVVAWEMRCELVDGTVEVLFSGVAEVRRTRILVAQLT